MFFQHALFRHRAWRIGGLGMLLLALALRGLIPVGYMPRLAHTTPAWHVWLDICHGTAAPHDAPLDAHTPCPFAVFLSQSALWTPTGWWATYWPREHAATPCGQPSPVPTLALYVPVGARAPPVQHRTFSPFRMYSLI